MNTNLEYCVAYGHGAGDLSRAVQLLICTGWTPLGGVDVCHCPHDALNRDRFIYAQAMQRNGQMQRMLEMMETKLAALNP